MNLLQKPPVATVLSGHTDSIAEASRTLDTLTVAWRVLGVGKTVAEVAKSHLCTAADIRLALRSRGRSIGCRVRARRGYPPS